MPGELELKLRLTADNKGFVGEVKVARRELEKLGGNTGKAARAAREHTRALRRGEACIIFPVDFATDRVFRHETFHPRRPPRIHRVEIGHH